MEILHSFLQTHLTDLNFLTHSRMEIFHTPFCRHISQLWTFSPTPGLRFYTPFYRRSSQFRSSLTHPRTEILHPFLQTQLTALNFFIHPLDFFEIFFCRQLRALNFSHPPQDRAFSRPVLPDCHRKKREERDSHSDSLQPAQQFGVHQSCRHWRNTCKTGIRKLIKWLLIIDDSYAEQIFGKNKNSMC